LIARSYDVGERHERPFISSSPTVVLSHIAALTKRIRLFTAVTTLSLLDPVRAFEDYATLDQLSGGRLELIIGKGNGAAQRDLFNVTPDDQWDRNAECYEVFRRLRQDLTLPLAGGQLAGAAKYDRVLRRDGRAAECASLSPAALGSSGPCSPGGCWPGRLRSAAAPSTSMSSSWPTSRSRLRTWSPIGGCAR
jgi:hypothetical protein